MSRTARGQFFLTGRGDGKRRDQKEDTANSARERAGTLSLVLNAGYLYLVRFKGGYLTPVDGEIKVLNSSGSLVVVSELRVGVSVHAVGGEFL